MDAEFSGPIGTIYQVGCPESCADELLNLFGDELYSGDSSICQASIHSGLYGNLGGDVELIVLDGSKKYDGASKNGLVSESKGEFMKSFKIIGDFANACRLFDEVYEPTKVTSNWEANDIDGVESDWTFVPNPGDMTKNKLAFR